MRVSDIALFRDVVALDRLAQNSDDPLYREWFGYAHDRGQNIVFLDGHAQFSAESAWMQWPGDAMQFGYADPPPEFPRWLTGSAPPS